MIFESIFTNNKYYSRIRTGSICQYKQRKNLYGHLINRRGPVRCERWISSESSWTWHAVASTSRTCTLFTGEKTNLQKMKVLYKNTTTLLVRTIERFPHCSETSRPATVWCIAHSKRHTNDCASNARCRSRAPPAPAPLQCPRPLRLPLRPPPQEFGMMRCSLVVICPQGASQKAVQQVTQRLL